MKQQEMISLLEKFSTEDIHKIFVTKDLDELILLFPTAIAEELKIYRKVFESHEYIKKIEKILENIIIKRFIDKTL